MLVLDDVKDAAAHVAGALWLKGIRAIKSHTPSECIGVLQELDREKKEKPDIVLLNGNLAADNGGYLVMKIKEISPGTAIFIIANGESDRARALHLACDDVAESR